MKNLIATLLLLLLCFYSKVTSKPKKGHSNHRQDS